MKNFLISLFSKFLNWVTLWLGFIVVLWVYSVYSAYTTIGSVNSWDKLQSSTFNTLIANVDDLNTRVNIIASSSHFFWDRIAVALWTTYQANKDGLLVVIWRTDWATWWKRVSVVADTSATPTTIRWESDWYNNWNRLWSYQLTIPIKKWEYYKILCAWGTTCWGSYFIGWYNAYFTPIN